MVADPNHDDVCFHAEQCAEKYLKAILQERGTAFPRTHDLAAIVALAAQADASLAVLREQCDFLTGFAVNFHYPGEWAEKATASDAVQAAKEVRRTARQIFGLQA